MTVDGAALAGTLPVPPAPLGAYARGVIRNGTGMLSGQFPLSGGVVLHPGRLGGEVDVAQGRAAAGLAARNVVAQLSVLLSGDLGRLDGLLRVDVLLASAPGFTEYALVADGASEALLELLGGKGVHARSITPVHALPLNAAIELVVTFAMVPGAPAAP